MFFAVHYKITSYKSKVTQLRALFCPDANDGALEYILSGQIFIADMNYCTYYYNFAQKIRKLFVVHKLQNAYDKVAPTFTQKSVVPSIRRSLGQGEGK